MADHFSPTGYWAHYRTVHRNGDQITFVDTETYPVVGYTDVALVIETDGTVRTVRSLRDELADGGDTPDVDGETFRVSLEVNTSPGE